MREQAGHNRSAPAAAVPERHFLESNCHRLLQEVTELGWLSPCAASLAALGQPPAPAIWSTLRDDPGAVLLMLRLPDDQPPSFISLLHDPQLPAAAVQYLDASTVGSVNWNDPALAPIYQAGLTYVRIAEQLAVSTGQADADAAWICGLLAPLGWFAVCAVAPANAAACLAAMSRSHDAMESQLRHWGADNAAIARRLARHGSCPDGSRRSSDISVCPKHRRGRSAHRRHCSI